MINKTPASMLNDEDDSQDFNRAMTSKFKITSAAFRENGTNNCCVSPSIQENKSDY